MSMLSQLARPRRRYDDPCVNTEVAPDSRCEVGVSANLNGIFRIPVCGPRRVVKHVSLLNGRSLGQLGFLHNWW